MRKILIFLLLLVIPFVSAVPQVIFTDLNLTINSSGEGMANFRLLGEGLDAQSSFSTNGNCSFSYSRYNIPMTFSRDFQRNETDMAILLHALSTNANATELFFNCSKSIAAQISVIL